MRLGNFALIVASILLLAACGERAKLPEGAGYGPHPMLTAPNATLLPTINFAKALGWPKGGKPKPASGLAVAAFASGLEHPRWLLVLPNGDVLVAETTAPPQPDEFKGFRGFIARLVLGDVGAGSKSPNRIILLRDSDGDGVADKRFVLLKNLNSPFGMALVDTTLYVANTDAVWAFPYHDGDTEITDPGRKIVALPAGTINHHWTKNVIASRDGAKLYVTIGSNSNVGENGMAAESGRADIWEVDAATGKHRVFASGIRNGNGMAWAPGTDTFWVAVNERDEIGSDLVPDYMTSVRDGGFYGWPYSYYGQHVDDRIQPQRPDLVARAIAPDYALGAHTASLGLIFSTDAKLGEAYAQGVYVAQHGSWNRDPRAGYRVIFVPFKDGKPAGMPAEVLSGFLSAEGEAQGRPVGLAIDKTGALLVADDVGNTVWRVTKP